MVRIHSVGLLSLHINLNMLCNMSQDTEGIWCIYESILHAQVLCRYPEEMRRRDFLKTALSGILLCGFSSNVLAGKCITRSNRVPDDAIRDYFQKLKDFDKPHPGDHFLQPGKLNILKSSLWRLKRLQRTIGYGNFHLLSFDDSIKIAKNYSKVGRFSKVELDFLEWLFYRDAARYGFLGKKPLNNLTDQIQKKNVVKVRGTGNYLYRDSALTLYSKLRSEVGNQLILTSGVRSIMKQTLLFLSKAHRIRGNLSLASRSLAPPGFSYHGVGDFDVGQVGFGVSNFTERFAETPVFAKLKKLDYVDLRYTKDNLVGVRFEPWHIKVISPSIQTFSWVP